MPPKVKITKEDIINTAIDVVRQSGTDAINARNIAAQLGCSTQPIFSHFATMDELHFAVLKKADELYTKYLTREIAEEKFPAYKASGIAYIRFAKEEKELFKLLFMRDRTDEKNQERPVSNNLVNDLVHSATGLSGEDAKLFHFKMWVCVHGIATMIATGFLELDWDIISKTISDTYIGIKKQCEE